MSQPPYPQQTQVKVSQSEAILIAQNECRKRGWPWLEPIKVWAHRGKWIMHTNHEARGANVRLAIKQDTGEIVEAVFMPR